jgi:hypothetical protein
VANYLVLIYDNEAELAAADEAALQRNHERHGAFGRANASALRGGARLTGSESATALRSGADGEYTVTDGTFAETKEVLGGFYIIEAADLDEALRIARQVPAPFGGLEVRPIMPM